LIDEKCDFWDLVILSAGDERQAKGFQKRIEDKWSQTQFYKRFRVVADPGGRRVGDGGSTLHILAELVQYKLLKFLWIRKVSL